MASQQELIVKLRADAADYQRTMREVSERLKGLDVDVTRLNTAGQRFDLRGVSQQLSQVGQSSMATGNFVQSLAIQLPDLGLALGPVGAAAGLAAGLILPLATNLFNLGEASETAEDRAQALEERLSGLTSAVDAYIASADRGAISTAELEEKYGTASEAARTFIAALREIDTVNVGEAIDASLDSIAGRLGDFGGDLALSAGQSIVAQIDAVQAEIDRLNLKAPSMGGQGMSDADVTRVEELTAQREALRAFLDDAADLAAELGISEEAAVGLARAFNALGAAEGVPDQLAAAKGLSAALLAAFGSVEQMPPAIRDLYKEVATAADKMGELQGKAEAAAISMSDLINAVKTGAEGLEGAFDKLGEPFVERLREALGLIEDMGDRSLDAYREYQGSRRAATFIPSPGEDASAALLRQLENPNGIWTTPHWDTNALRIGYSSDTITRADGTVQHGVNPGDTVTQADADRDLARRIELQHEDIARLVGAGRWGMFGPGQQAALTSVGYNYGTIGPGGANIADVVRTGDIEAIARAIENLSENPERRQVEADIFRSGGGVQGAGQRLTAAEEREAAEATREAEEAARKSEAARKAEADALEAARTAYDSLVGSMDPATAAQNALAEGQRVVNEALARGAITATEAAQAMDLLQARYSADEVARATAAIIEGGADAAEAAQAAADNARDTTRGLIDDLLQGATAAEAFANVLGKIGSQFIDAGLDSLFSSPGVGNIFAGLFGGARAAGGPVLPGKTYLVGEKGPELFAPSAGGTIIPAGQWESAVMVDPMGALMPGGGFLERAERQMQAVAARPPERAAPQEVNVVVDVADDGKLQAYVERASAATVRQGIAANNRHIVPKLAREAVRNPRVR